MPANPPPIFPFGRPPNALRFRDLPERIKRKIKKEGREDTGCWHWTGTVNKARHRLKRYRRHAEYNGLGDKVGSFETERATPECTDPLSKKRAPVHRIIFGIVTGMPLYEVPELRRCADDRCVSPHHVLAVGYTSAQRGRRTETEAEAEAATAQSSKACEAPAGSDLAAMTDEEVLAALQQHRPFIETDDLRFVEEECEIPSGRLTFELWAVHVNWDATNPEND